MDGTRTLEQRIKFDFGLTIGQHLVKFVRGDRFVLALVEIGSRGQVYYFAKPEVGDMYASWKRIRGDKTIVGEGAVKVWPEKDVEFMARFDATPAVTIELA